MSAVGAFSTGQFLERINDNEVNKGLASYLLELDSVSFSKIKERIPKGMVSTALWRNYIGHWKIKNDSLFLDSILVKDETCDTLRFIPAIIDDIYAARRAPSGFFADWVTDTIRLVSDDVVHYEHMGWESTWVKEEFVSVKDGLIKNRIEYENRVVNQVNDYDSRKIIDSLNLGFIPGRIILKFGYQGFDENGNPTGYKVNVLRSCGDTIVDNRVARVLRDSTVIRKLVPIYYIRGEYKSEVCYLNLPKSRIPHDSIN